MNEAHYEATLARLRLLMENLGDLVESFDYAPQFWLPLRHVFAQYRHRTQVDLTVTCAPTSAIPRVVVLYDPEGAVSLVSDQALEPEADEVRVWACQAWVALANVGKYLRRSSPWEALRARSTMHVPTCSGSGPSPSLSPKPATASPRSLTPLERGCRPGIEKSLAGADVGELLVASRYLAKTLADLQERLHGAGPYRLPFVFGEFIRADLAALQ